MDFVRSVAYGRLTLGSFGFARLRGFGKLDEWVHDKASQRISKK